jgi:hypothetical protein
MTEANEALGWDDVISGDDDDFQLIPEGVYPFEIIDLQRGQHKQIGVIPDCPKAILKVRVYHAPGTYSDLRHTLYLHKTRMGLLCVFLKSIGQRKHGDAKAADWSRVVGAKGHCKVTIGEWKPNGSNGESVRKNEIRFLDPIKVVPQPAQSEGF